MAVASPQNALGIKSLLGTESLVKSQIRLIIDTAQEYRKLQDSKLDKIQSSLLGSLKGKTVVLLFFEASTRTRSSFELAAKRLGAEVIVLTQQMSSVDKGETLLDTARNIEAMQPDLLVLRHPSAGSPMYLDGALKIPIVNGGDGFHEHPTQALLDLMTIEEFKGSLEGLKVLIVGDIAHSRVARSDIYALKAMGCSVSVCAPPTLMPPKVEKMGVQAFTHLDEAVLGQDVVIALRVQFERMNQGQLPSRAEYSRFYGINARVLKLCKEDVLIMHPGPVNRGVELATEVADSERSVILNQVSNGVLIRMAVLHLLTKKE